MSNLTLSESTMRRLAQRAAELQISVDELANILLNAETPWQTWAAGVVEPLEGDAWLAEVEGWRADVQARAGQYPPGFELDDSRETLYREREDAQL